MSDTADREPADREPGWLARLRNSPPAETRQPSEPAPAAPARHLADERAIQPDLAILDTQHHFLDGTLAMKELLTAVSSCGHRVVGTIFAEACYHYQTDGPEELRSIGEVAFVRAEAERAAQTVPQFGLCRGIVGHADLLLGDRVVPVLEALIEAGGGRLCAVRDVVAWDCDPRFRFAPPIGPPEGMMSDRRFQAGLRQLKRFGLVFNVSLFGPQLPEFLELAKEHHDTVMVLDHVGLPLYVTRPDRSREVALEEWRRAMTDVAVLRNVAVKIANLPWLGGIAHLADGPSSDRLAATWQPFVDTVVELFGPERCMLASDFTHLVPLCTYTVLWNALNKATSAYGPTERDRMFHGTAEAIYAL